MSNASRAKEIREAIDALKKDYRTKLDSLLAELRLAEPNPHDSPQLGNLDYDQAGMDQHLEFMM